MKTTLIVSLCLWLSLTGHAQKSIDEKLYSIYLNDTISYTVWMPENAPLAQQYTTIYTFSYGASDAAFTAALIQYLNKLNVTNLPPTIIVNIRADMDRMGYNYETGLLTVQGERMVECLKKEIIPVLARKYKASGFRTYMGQSYGASYGNHLLLFYPEIFSGYMLFSPEKLAPTQPPFEFTTELTQFYSSRFTLYFLASGRYDIQRRQDYAGEIAQKVKRLDSTKFNFQYENLLKAGHNNSTVIGLPLALDFIYRQYNSFPELDSGVSILKALKRYERRIFDLYGILPEKNSFHVYQPFLSSIWQRKDSTGMVEAINYFISNKTGGRQLRDFAYSCWVVGLDAKAYLLYEKAIKKILADEMLSPFSPSALITCYRELAFNVLKDKPQQGWELLQKALNVCLQYKANIHISYYPDIYFYLGKFAADNNWKVKEGLNYLLLYAEKRKDLVDIIHVGLDEVHYNIGKSYSLLNDTTNATQYLQKALYLNAGYEKAKTLLKNLQRDK